MNETPKQPSHPRPLDDPLKDLSARDREMLEAVLKHHPKLTPEEALEALREAGM